MPEKIVIEIPDEVAKFMSRYHISQVNLVQAGYDILKVIHGERKIPDKEAIGKVMYAMYGHYDEKERIKKEAESYDSKVEDALKASSRLMSTGKL